MSMTIVTINDNKGCGSSYLTLQRSKRLGGGGCVCLIYSVSTMPIKASHTAGGEGGPKNIC